jgi:hypothetical protein
VFLIPLWKTDVKGYDMYDLIPLTEAWLEKEGFEVSILANKVSGTKRTGLFSLERITIFFEDNPYGCLVRMEGSSDICKRAEDYLLKLPQRKITTTKGETVIVKERETISIPCSYCGTLIPLPEKKCPNCGAPVRR